MVFTALNSTWLLSGSVSVADVAAVVGSVYKDVEVVAVNDPFIGLDYAKYLFTHDTIHGKFEGECEIKNSKLVVNGNSISF